MEYHIESVKLQTQRLFNPFAPFDRLTCSKDQAYNGCPGVGECGETHLFVAFAGSHKLPTEMSARLKLVHRLCGASIDLEVLSDLG